jgi:hypothetical protein
MWVQFPSPAPNQHILPKTLCTKPDFFLDKGGKDSEFKRATDQLPQQTDKNRASDCEFIKQVFNRHRKPHHQRCFEGNIPRFR